MLISERRKQRRKPATERRMQQQGGPSMGTSIFDEEAAAKYLRKIGVYDHIDSVDVRKNPDETLGKSPIQIKGTLHRIPEGELGSIIDGILSRSDYRLEKVGDGSGYTLELENRKYSVHLSFSLPADMREKIQEGKGPLFDANRRKNALLLSSSRVEYGDLGHHPIMMAYFV